MARAREVPINVLARYFRVPTGGMPVYYPGRDELWSSMITNISVTGVFVRTSRPLPIGTALQLAFVLPDGSPVDAEAVVRWVAAPETQKRKVRLNTATSEGMGLEFTEISRTQVRAIEKFVKAFLARMRRR